MAERDWYNWHAPYSHPSSGLSLRLSWLQERIRAALDETPPGLIRLISMCAGQGYDVLGALPDHPRRGDVTARLVELDPATPKPPGEPPPSAALLADGVSQRGRCHPTEFAGLLGQARRIAAADPGRFQRMLDRSTGYGYRI